MQNTNWIILASKDRGIEYGVGTFIKHLSRGLATRSGINVFIFEIGITEKKSFSIRKNNGITIYELPLTKNVNGIDTKINQEKISRIIARIASVNLPKSDITIIHMNYTFQYFIGYELKKILKGFLIHTQHILPNKEYQKANFFDIMGQAYQTVDKIIVLTNQAKDQIIKEWGNEEKIKIIYNGIDSNLFTKHKKDENIRKKYGIKKNTPIILYVGRLDPGKGLKFLMEAFKLLLNKAPNCQLVLAGDGNFMEVIELARPFSSQINYLGFVPFDDLVSLYSEANIGVIPSLQEQCSYVALEMLHCGLPVVASNLGGLKEIFIHGQNALLADTITDNSNLFGVSPEINQLTNHMHKLLSDENLKTEFSRNAIIRANENFTLDTMIKNYIQTIKNLN